MNSSRPTKDTVLNKRRKAVYVLPNLLTTASLFCGFWAILAAVQGRYSEAAASLFASAVLDGLDGKVARLTGSSSNFGVEYDSLADLVAFGVAPAFIIHQWMLTDYGRLGLIACFVYVVCGALRLARFNSQIEKTDSRYFVGLPIPAAAMTLAAFVRVAEMQGWSGGGTAVMSLIMLYGLAFLMVSTVPFRSAKAVEIRKLKSFNYLVMGVLIFSLIALQPSTVVLLGMAVYITANLTMMVYRHIKHLPIPNAKEKLGLDSAGNGE